MAATDPARTATDLWDAPGSTALAFLIADKAGIGQHAAEVLVGQASATGAVSFTTETKVTSPTIRNQAPQRREWYAERHGARYTLKAFDGR